MAIPEKMHGCVCVWDTGWG